MVQHAGDTPASALYDSQMDTDGGDVMDQMPEFVATRNAHMLDRPHPLTGEPVIYAPFGTCMGITGLSDEAAFALLSKLAAHCVQTKYQYQHIHEHGVLLIYDNHQIAHRSSPQQKAAEDMNTLRLLYRISTKINATSEWYGKT